MAIPANLKHRTTLDRMPVAPLPVSVIMGVYNAQEPVVASIRRIVSAA